MPVAPRFTYVYACGFYAALACAMTYPLVLHPSSTIPHDLGDPLISTTLLWWNAHIQPLTDRWWDGFAFYPARGMLALSDHRLGESLVAAPLQWLGATPVTAYNVTLLATFPLSALAAHWLAFTLTGRHDAALVCGVVYGFCPYRIAHLQHLELLASAGMPAALAALHRYHQTGAPRWLGWFALALTVQGLCTSYYLLFFTVLLALWMIWFVGWRDPQRFAAIAIAAAAATLVLLPIIGGYERIHAWYGLARPFDDIVRLSADVTALGAASPLIALWGWTSKWARSEGELFPGLTIVVLAAAGVALAWRRARVPRDRVDRWAAWLLVAAAAFLLLAIAGWLAAPWQVRLFALRVSSAAAFKPFSLAVVASMLWFAASSRMRAAYHRRSALAFYGIATAILFLCSLGPQPALNGHQILYKPVYAWLMALPPFGAVRVPARFAMLMMLTLAVTGALAVSRFRLGPRNRRIAIAVILAGVAADMWPATVPLVALPEVWPASRANGFAAVLELPLGDVFDDAAAMYRATVHRHPLVNGTSGFEPTHYFTLRTALEEHDPAALDGFPQGRLLIVVDIQKDAGRGWRTYLASMPRVTDAGHDDRWAFFAAEPPVAASSCAGPAAPVASLAATGGSANLDVLTDRDPATWWAAPHAQQVGDQLQLDLGRPVHPCAVVLSVGEFRKSYPRQLAVDTSLTGSEWTTVAIERTAGLTMRGALADPKSVSIVIPLTASTARFVRLRIVEPHPTIAWMATGVSVRVSSEEE